VLLATRRRLDWLAYVAAALAVPTLWVARLSALVGAPRLWLVDPTVTTVSNDPEAGGAVGQDPR